MADVYIVVFSVIGILVSYPGLVAAYNLLLPRATEAAYLRLAHTPRAAFIVGLPITGGFVLFSVILVNVNFGPAKAVGFMAALVLMGISALGGAGLARLMGERIDAINPSGSPLSNMIRGAIILELASAFPLVGWFLVTPITLIITVGAAAFGLIGWKPKAKPAAQVHHSDVDITTFTPLEA